MDWTDPVNKPVRPNLLGNKVINDFPIQDVVDYIDWNPFFQVGAAKRSVKQATGCFVALT